MPPLSSGAHAVPPQAYTRQRCAHRDRRIRHRQLSGTKEAGKVGPAVRHWDTQAARLVQTPERLSQCEHRGHRLRGFNRDQRSFHSFSQPESRTLPNFKSFLLV